MPDKKRDYKAEYARFHSKPAEKKRRAARNKARRMMERGGAVRKGDGKDVDHKDSNPHNNRKSNLRVTTRKANRGRRSKTGKTI